MFHMKHFKNVISIKSCFTWNNYFLISKIGYKRISSFVSRETDFYVFIIISVSHESLYKYCFNKYKNFLIVDKDNFDIDDNFYKGNLYIKKSFSYPLTKEEESLVNIVIKLDKLDNYKNNDQVGSVIVNLKDKKIFETEVYVKKDKNKKENLLKRIIKFLKKLFK